jgi:uncharacterized delta-60 repeat protein
MVCTGWRQFLCAVVVVANFGFPSVCLAAPADRDPSFSGDGITSTDFGGTDTAEAVALQADGKIVAAGRRYTSLEKSSLAVSRYLPDGTLDGSFANAGILVEDFGGTARSADLALQPDGRILVAGSLNGDLAIWRYLADGTPDTAFSADGVVTVDFGSDDSALALAILPGGRIAAVGMSNVFSQARLAIARFTPAGEPDQTFAGDGAETYGEMRNGTDVVSGSDGKIVISGTGSEAGGRLTLARFGADGALDQSFGEGGFAEVGAGARAVTAEAVSQTSDGTLYVAGSLTDFGTIHAPATVTGVIARFSPDGVPDGSFGSDGLGGENFPSGITDLTLASGHSLIVTGGSAVGRYLETGQPDTTFSGDGVAGRAFAGAAKGLTTQSDGRIVVAGRVPQDEGDFSLTRLLVAPGPADADADGLLDRSDPCPEVPAPDAGCPQVKRQIALDYDRPANEFTGRIRVPPAAPCVEDERISVFRVEKGADKRIRRDRTNGSGRYGFRYPDRPGSYYASLRETLVPSFGLCLKARSKRTAVPQPGTTGGSIDLGPPGPPR